MIGCENVKIRRFITNLIQKESYSKGLESIEIINFAAFCMDGLDHIDPHEYALPCVDLVLTGVKPRLF